MQHNQLKTNSANLHGLTAQQKLPFFGAIAKRGLSGESWALSKTMKNLSIVAFNLKSAPKRYLSHPSITLVSRACVGSQLLGAFEAKPNGHSESLAPAQHSADECVTHLGTYDSPSLSGLTESTMKILKISI